MSESVFYLVRMILIRLWRKIELTNPYGDLAQICEIRKFSENMPTVRQNAYTGVIGSSSYLGINA